jgi:hypothetical protein
MALFDIAGERPALLAHTSGYKCIGIKCKEKVKVVSWTLRGKNLELSNLKLLHL